MIDSVLSFIQQHAEWAWAFAFAIAFAESLIIVGFFVPGWVLLIALGGLVGAQIVAFLPVFMAAYVGAVLGEGLGFSLGFAHSEKIRRSRWLQQHQESVLLAENLFLRYGALSLIVGRFVGPVRAVLPFVAGFLYYSRPRYWLINVATGAVWAAAYLMPGMLAGTATQLEWHEAQPMMLHLSFLVVCAGAAWWWRTHKLWRNVFLFIALSATIAFPFMPWWPVVVQWWQLFVEVL